MNPKRKKIFDKTGGKCAYCGCDLQRGWHVDELLPCKRTWERRKNKNGIWKRAMTGYEHPERLVFDNQWAACSSCNINKHSASLEDFRNLIQNFTRTLNHNSTQYKIAKRYGLIQETPKPVIFYFETLNTDNK